MCVVFVLFICKSDLIHDEYSWRHRSIFLTHQKSFQDPAHYRLAAVICSTTSSSPASPAGHWRCVCPAVWDIYKLRFIGIVTTHLSIVDECAALSRPFLLSPFLCRVLAGQVCACVKVALDKTGGVIVNGLNRKLSDVVFLWMCVCRRGLRSKQLLSATMTCQTHNLGIKKNATLLWFGFAKNKSL